MEDKTKNAGRQRPETLSPKQTSLLEKRFEDYKVNSDSGLTWAELKKRLADRKNAGKNSTPP